jgi:hypothetical protein
MEIEEYQPSLRYGRDGGRNSAPADVRQVGGMLGVEVHRRRGHETPECEHQGDRGSRVDRPRHPPSISRRRVEQSRQRRRMSDTSVEHCTRTVIQSRVLIG